MQVLLLLFSCTWLQLFAGSFAAEMDCNKPIEMYAISNCCTMPKLDLSYYKKACEKYVTDDAHLTPCSFECLFRAAEVFNGTTLLMDEVMIMLQHLLKGNDAFMDAYAEGFRKCLQQEQIILRRLQNRRKLSKQEQCSPLASIYGMCAHTYVYVNCPAESWSKSITCNQAKDYILNCELAKSSAIKERTRGRQRS